MDSLTFSLSTLDTIYCVLYSTRMTYLNLVVQPVDSHAPSSGPPDQRPFTPETLAIRWSCSAEKVRQMLNRGELAGFRLGKLIRIPAVEVERFECQALHPVLHTISLNIEESSPSQLDAERTAAESRLARMTRV